jgi:hypothetical protein
MEHPAQKEQPPMLAPDTLAPSDIPATRAFPPELPDIEEGQIGTRPQSVVEQHHTIPPVPLASATDDADECMSSSASQHDDANTADVTQQPAEQLSRHAALLRAANAAGHADTSLPTAVLPRQSNPGADAQAPLLGQDSPQTSVQGTRQARQMAEPENGFPIGPAPLGRTAMAELMARVASSPAIIAGQANEVGVTKNRLAELLKSAHTSQTKELAETLLAWFDLAGLLAEPSKTGRLRHPRPLTTTNLAEIAALLTATACPDPSTVKMLWERSNEGKE